VQHDRRGRVLQVVEDPRFVIGYTGKNKQEKRTIKEEK
jgi:hypothetical protein